MIATVRIASIEQWCEGAKEALAFRPEMKKEVGRPVRILTETSRLEIDGHRSWSIASEDLEWFQEFTDSLCGRICEHLLEMD
jgi:hypothetical protein